MTMENQSYEDVFPIENGEFSNVTLVFRGVLWPSHETAKKEIKFGVFRGWDHLERPG